MIFLIGSIIFLKNSKIKIIRFKTESYYLEIEAKQLVQTVMEKDLEKRLIMLKLEVKQFLI